MRSATPNLERALREVPRLRDSLRVNHADDNGDAVLFEPFEFLELRDRNERAVDKQGVEPLALCPTGNVGVKSFSRFYHRLENFERPTSRRGLDLFHDRGDALFFDRQ